MGMFGPKIGSWWITCKSDPRWNASGRGYGLVSSGGPPDLQDKIKELKELYGEPPEDCYQGFMKD